MKFRFIVVGRHKNDPMVEASGEYLARIARYVPVELVEVKEASRGRAASVSRIRKLEVERVRAALSRDDRVVALDERGRALSSVVLSERLETWMQAGPRSVAFVVGGPVGLDPDFLRAADERWSLSALTLPHRLARLVLMEQVYRGLTILRGEPYHK